MTNETLRMQMLSGIITESEYKAKLEENIYDLTSFHKGSHSTGRPNFNEMTADEIENYLEKDKNNPGGLSGRSLSIVKHILNKKRKEEKESLNEHYVAGGIVGIGAINQIPSHVKTDYEDAFEYFLSQKYSLNEMEDEVEEGKEVEKSSLHEDIDEEVKRKIMQMVDNTPFENSDKGNDLIFAVTKTLFTPGGQQIFKNQMQKKLKQEHSATDYYSAKDKEAINKFFNNPE